MKVGVLATMVLAISIGYPVASFAGLAPDADSDGIPDVLDKCTIDSRNATAVPGGTCDTDVDGYGNPCDGDFNQNNLVQADDFSMFFIPAFKGVDKAPWPEGMDMNCNNLMQADDFSMYFIPKFKNVPAFGGAKPGPSGLSCAGTPGCS